MNETQNQRIARLGNPARIWHGQSGFWLPVTFPVLEHVVILGRTELPCAGCGKPLASGALWGSMVLGDEVVVEHVNRREFRVYHCGCAPTGVRWVHESAPQARMTLF